MTDREIASLHGDDKKHPIAQWRREYQNKETALSYVDWRADRKWQEVQP